MVPVAGLAVGMAAREESAAMIPAAQELALPQVLEGLAVRQRVAFAACERWSLTWFQ